jgi:N-acetylmuramoyl-L-alanine amidase
MKIVLNAGHTVAGAGTGAIGHIIESIEARKIVNAVKRYLDMKGHDVTVVNIDKAPSQAEYLASAVRKANEVNIDLFVSIHFNAGNSQGCECYTWKGKRISAAIGVCGELQKLGFRNRGVKDGSNLYVIKKTKAEAVLIEVCFCDNRNDVELYKRLGVNRVAQAITRGILK